MVKPGDHFAGAGKMIRKLIAGFLAPMARVFESSLVSPTIGWRNAFIFSAATGCRNYPIWVQPISATNGGSFSLLTALAPRIVRNECVA